MRNILLAPCLLNNLPPLFKYESPPKKWKKLAAYSPSHHLKLRAERVVCHTSGVIRQIQYAFTSTEKMIALILPPKHFRNYAQQWKSRNLFKQQNLGKSCTKFSLSQTHTHIQWADGGKAASSLLVTSAQESDITNAVSSSSCWNQLKPFSEDHGRWKITLPTLQPECVNEKKTWQLSSPLIFMVLKDPDYKTHLVILECLMCLLGINKAHAYVWIRKTDIALHLDKERYQQSCMNKHCCISKCCGCSVFHN